MKDDFELFDTENAMAYHPKNPNRIILATIPNTGSILVRTMFNDIGYVSHTLPEEPRTEKVIHFEHIIQPHNLMLAHYMSKEFITVIPLRHPYVVTKSWEERNTNLANLYTAYRNLIKYFPNAIYVPIDVRQERRDKSLAILRAAIHPDLNTNWQPVNEIKGNAHLRYHDIKEPNSMCVELVNEIMPFLWKVGYYP